MAILGAVVLLLLAGEPGAEPPPARRAPGTAARIYRVHPRNFQVVKRTSGPVSYYQVIEGPDGPLLRARYEPPLETVVLGVEIPRRLRGSVSAVRWRWRVHVLPAGADDCRPEVGDAAAGVFLTFRVGPKTRIMKYVWNTTGAVGTICHMVRSPFFDKDEVVLRVGPPLDVWAQEEVDFRADYVRSFGGDLDDVPDLVGLGILTDGDATASRSEADYADFELVAGPTAPKQRSLGQ